MERHSPITTPFVLGGAESTVYTWKDLRPPAEVPVTFFNVGETVALIRVQGNTDYVPVGPASFITFNPSGDVYATVAAGVGNLLVCTGMRAGSAGVSSTGALTTSELAALNASYSQKEALWLLLRQAQLTNEYLARIIDEQLSERDLSPHVHGVHMP
jgi:hypothetical protein